MSASSSPSVQSRNTNDKLYQVCYDAVVRGVQQLHITRRSDRGGESAVACAPSKSLKLATAVTLDHNNTNINKPPGPICHINCAAATSTSVPLSTTDPSADNLSQRPRFPSLPSPSTSLRTTNSVASRQGASTSSTDVCKTDSALTASPMDRSSLHGAPPRGPTGGPPRHRMQDARANLAVQPATPPAKISMKKAAVKVVRPSGNPVPAPAPTPTSAPSPVPAPAPATPTAGPVKSAFKAEEGYGTSNTVTPNPNFKDKLESMLTTPASIKTESTRDAESDLDALFNRLTSPHPAAAPAAADQIQRSTAPDKARFNFDFTAPRLTATDVLKSYTDSPPKETVVTKDTLAPPPRSAYTGKAHEEGGQKPTQSKVEEAGSRAVVEKPAEAKRDNSVQGNIGEDDLEIKYMSKAADYLNALPTGGKAVTADLIKNAAAKLHRPYRPSPYLEPDAVESLKSRYLETVVTFCNDKGKARGITVTKEFVEQTLTKSDGDFLQLCAALVHEKVIAIDRLDEVVGLCKALVDILPTDAEVEAAVTKALEVKPVSNDPMDNMNTWPTQEKRDNPAECRTCLIKGATGFTTINQFQALVWGGRLESIHLPSVNNPGFALVRFLTAAACSKYFDATENGIVIPGEKKIVAEVEMQPGPNSTNDVIRACIEGDASRCVRAYDADQDWEYPALLRLAKGKGEMQRGLDRIKRGKTARGRFYIEFRFSNIYHALTFKRSLVTDEDWEHCTIGYAPDPCETARGIHLTDEDDEANDTGLFV